MEAFDETMKATALVNKHMDKIKAQIQGEYPEVLGFEIDVKADRLWLNLPRSRLLCVLSQVLSTYGETL